MTGSVIVSSDLGHFSVSHSVVDIWIKPVWPGMTPTHLQQLNNTSSSDSNQKAVLVSLSCKSAVALPSLLQCSVIQSVKGVSLERAHKALRSGLMRQSFWRNTIFRIPLDVIWRWGGALCTDSCAQLVKGGVEGKHIQSFVRSVWETYCAGSSVFLEINLWCLSVHCRSPWGCLQSKTKIWVLSLYKVSSFYSAALTREMPWEPIFRSYKGCMIFPFRTEIRLFSHNSYGHHF